LGTATIIVARRCGVAEENDAATERVNPQQAEGKARLSNFGEWYYLPEPPD